MCYVEAFKIWGDSENRAIFSKAPEDLINGSCNEAHHGDKRGDPDIEINLFRVIEEALNNIKMHAAADNVTINMVHLSPKYCRLKMTAEALI